MRFLMMLDAMGVIVRVARARDRAGNRGSEELDVRCAVVGLLLARSRRVAVQETEQRMVGVGAGGSEERDVRWPGHVAVAYHVLAAAA